MPTSAKPEVYVPCECRVSLFFPAGHIECNLCPLLETYSRRECRRTGEYLPSWLLRGYFCPLEVPGELITDPNTGEIKEELD